jgi:predicted metalloprotease
MENVMRWTGGRRGGNVEDRRGLSGGGLAAGGGIGALIIGLLGYYFLGISPSTTQSLLSQFGGLGQERGEIGTPRDDAGMFVDVIGTNIDDVWSSLLNGYTNPKVVLYDQGTGTGCGYGQSAMGPFYCPNDQTVYLDLNFWQQMQELGGSKADFAKAYVIAHEFGHHVQTLTGASQKVQQAQQSLGQSEGNRYSVALELQADCYAGVWAANAPKVSNGEVAAEQGDLEEGLRTAQAIGDDTLQKRANGRVTPENFTHGTSAQRMQWLQAGFRSGDPAVCNGTFDGL